jgi:hypothetical protein
MAESRVRVDPSVSVADLQAALKSLFKDRKDRDLASYLAHPNHYTVTWKTAPDKDLMAATAVLMSNFAAIAPNTQISSPKLIKAVEAENKIDKIDFTKKDSQGFAQWCDLRIRMVLAQFRRCKQSEQVCRSGIFSQRSEHPSQEKRATGVPGFSRFRQSFFQAPPMDSVNFPPWPP